MDVNSEKISTLHPHFKQKEVYSLWCLFCYQKLSDRIMKALLLSDTSVDLYSSDTSPKPSTDLIGKFYTTETCNCKIKDMACTSCGNVVGYHVIFPCADCLNSCNNGHYWIFNRDASVVSQKYSSTGSVVKWADLGKESSPNSPIIDEPCR